MPIRNLNASQKTKHTPAGEIPVEWECHYLHDVLQKPVSGHSALGEDRPAGNGESGVLKLSSITKGSLVPSKNKVVRDPTSLVTPLRAGTAVISRSNTPDLVGAVAYVPDTYQNLFLPDLMWELSPKRDDCVDMRWLCYALNSATYRRHIIARANGTSASMCKITKGAFLSVKIALPPLPEQRRIAEILSTWDRAIEQTEKLIEAKKRLKKGLMQQLLTGKLRFPQFRDTEWHTCRLGDVFSERREAGRGELPLLSITANRGVIVRDEVDRKDTSNADKSKYKRIACGDIGYNTMRMWQGVSALSDREGIVSPAYTICVPNDGIVPEFASHLFKFSNMVHLFWRYSQGLVSDTLSLKYHPFSQIKVTLPPVKEQKAIARVLSALDKETAELAQAVAAFQQQKKGLMQKLLTGTIRVRDLH